MFKKGCSLFKFVDIKKDKLGTLCVATCIFKPLEKKRKKNNFFKSEIVGTLNFWALSYIEI